MAPSFVRIISGDLSTFAPPKRFKPMDAGSKTTQLDAAQLVEKHQSGLWRYMRVLGCDSHEASDLTQETFLTVLQKPFRQYNDAATAGYLRRVAYNLFITTKRRAGKVVAVENLDQINQDWQRWTRHDGADDLLEALRECLKGLGEKPRRALQLRFGEKMTRVEIAESLGMSEHGAKNVMQRAKKKLRSCIDRKLSSEQVK